MATGSHHHARSLVRQAQHGWWRPIADVAHQAVQIYSQPRELDVLVKNLGWQLRNAVVVQITTMAHGDENHGAHTYVHACRVSNELRQSALACSIGAWLSCIRPAWHCTHMCEDRPPDRRTHDHGRTLARQAQHRRWRSTEAVAAKQCESTHSNLSLTFLSKIWAGSSVMRLMLKKLQWHA